MTLVLTDHPAGCTTTSPEDLEENCPLLPFDAPPTSYTDLRKTSA